MLTRHGLGAENGNAKNTKEKVMKKRMMVGESKDYLEALDRLKIKPDDYAPGKRAIELLSASPKRTLIQVIGDPEIKDNIGHESNNDTVRIPSDFKFSAIRHTHPGKCACGCRGKGRISITISSLRWYPESGDTYARCYPVPEKQSV